MSLLLHQTNDKEWALRGPLNAQTIPRIWRKGQHCIDKSKVSQIELDLSEITAPDSASVALLLDWLRYAKKQGKNIHLHHVPKKMQDIIRLSNLQTILGNDVPA